MTERTIRLNPRLDPRDYAEAYARDGMVHSSSRPSAVIS